MNGVSTLKSWLYLKIKKERNVMFSILKKVFINKNLTYYIMACLLSNSEVVHRGYGENSNQALEMIHDIHKLPLVNRELQKERKKQLLPIHKLKNMTPMRFDVLLLYLPSNVKWYIFHSRLLFKLTLVSGHGLNRTFH